MWWFRRLPDKIRVVSSRFRRGFVVVACAICEPVISVLSTFDILHNMIPARITWSGYRFNQIEPTTPAAHAFNTGTHDFQKAEMRTLL